MRQEHAYITGGAGGIGFQLARLLTNKGIKVFIADQEKKILEESAKELGASYGVLDVTSWESQVKVFSDAVAESGRIDYVYPLAGIGERTWSPSATTTKSVSDFSQPDLFVLDVNLTGLLFTVSLAVQQFRRQEIGQNGFKGKILCAGSVCGIYCCSSLPIYTASKHAITGLVRSYGKQLPLENITMNAFCPNVVRTKFSSGAFYDKLEEKGLLTPIEGVLEVCEMLLGNNSISGECFEIGPNYAKGQGLIKPKFPEFVDDESKRVFDQLEARGNARQY